MMKASEAAALLLAQLGKPYVWGANGPKTFDCSGLAYWWTNRTGNKRPDTTAQGLFDRCRPATGDPRLGDLVFLFSYGKISHVGIILNKTTVIEARGRAYGVVRTPLSDFQKRGGYIFKGIRRDPAFALEADPVVVPPAERYRFDVGFAAQENARFGGLPSTSASRVAKLHTLVNYGIVGFTEADTAMVKAVLNTFRYHRVTLLSTGTLGVLTDSRRWGLRASREALHGDNYHGALCQPVVSTENGSHLDVIVNHTRPKSVASALGKDRDIRRAMSLMGTWRTLIMGDFAKNADKLMLEKGLRRISPNVDTYDPFGDDRIDAMYASSQVAVINTEILDPAEIADHKWIHAKVEIPVKEETKCLPV